LVNTLVLRSEVPLVRMELVRKLHSTKAFWLHVSYCLNAGVVVAATDENDPLLNKRVFLVPMRGWEKDPDAPESTYVSRGSKRLDSHNLG
jgi:hypothetical protein